MKKLTEKQTNHCITFILVMVALMVGYSIGFKHSDHIYQPLLSTRPTSNFRTSILQLDIKIPDGEEWNTSTIGVTKNSHDKFMINIPISRVNANMTLVSGKKL